VLYHLLDYLYDYPPGRYAYKDVLFRGTSALLLGFLLVWLLGPRVIAELRRRRVGDIPEFDHAALNEGAADKRNTPTMGGLLLSFAVLICVLSLADLRNYYIVMGLFCLIWLTTLGAVDDWLKLTLKRRGGSRDGLRMHEKLLFQIALALLLGNYIYQHGELNALTRAGEQISESFRILNVPFYKQGIILGKVAFFVVTILVITGTSNAVNLTDGMDGLAAGCMVLCSFAFLVLAYIGGDQERASQLLFPHIPETAELAVLCGAMMGACMGFLWHNCYPARVFMGDTGSLPLGGLIGYVAICTRQELMLFIVGGVFVIEAVSVMIQVGWFKMSGGKRIFRVAPIHHHFHLGGWTETQTVTRFWLLAAVFAGIALATVKLR
jgi:phospho-N-acetylmuramoyl-pentapeptide-transferase